MSRVPVTVLTGFLGAGKTTLLRSLLTQADGRRIAVIVNEFGDAGFDGGLVEECAAKACAPGDIVELTNGCICCTVADDFIPTMDKLLARDRPLDAIVIETSGLALPQPLLKAFDWPAVRTRATVDGVVTVVDALALSEGRVTIDEDAVAAQRAADDSLDHDDPIEEVFEDQLACADLVVLSKSDLVSPAALAGIEARLKSVLRPGVNIVRSKGDLAAPVLIGLNAAAEDDMAARAGHHGEEEEHDHDDFDSIVVMPSAAASVDAMRVRVSDALNLTGVLRVKGHARIADKAAPIVVQGVGGRVDLAFARPDVKQAEHLVVIGLKGFDGDAVRRALAGVAKDFRTDASEARQQRQHRRWRRRPRSRAGRPPTSSCCRRQTAISRHSVRPMRRWPADFPSVRLTNLLALGHPASVDLYVERTLCQARIVVLRMLGGESYWPHGVESLRADALRRGALFACIPGEMDWNAALAARGTLGSDETHALWRYCSEGGVENAELALRFAAHLIGHGEAPPRARPMPSAGFWRGEPANDERPNAIVIFYRALVAGGDTAGDRCAAGGASDAWPQCRVPVRHQPEG